MLFLRMWGMLLLYIAFMGAAIAAFAGVIFLTNAVAGPIGVAAVLVLSVSALFAWGLIRA